MGKFLYSLKLKLAEATPLTGNQGHIVFSASMVLIFALGLAIIGLPHIASGALGALLSWAVGYASELNDGRQPNNYFNRYDIRLNTAGCIIGFVAWGFLGALL